MDLNSNEKKALLILAQVDHLSGELLGSAMERVMELGVHNVHLIPSTTKKGRPGNILLIDADSESEEKIGKFLARDLRIYGYHRIETKHVFHTLLSVKKRLNIRINGKQESFPCEAKILGDPSHPISMDIEHDFLVEVQKALRMKHGFSISLIELRSQIEWALKESGDEIILEI